MLVLAYAVVAVRIHMRRIRFRENLDIADYILIVFALDTLALVTYDTLIYQTGASDSQLRSEKLSKVGLNLYSFYELESLAIAFAR